MARLLRRVPIMALQKGLYKLLCAGQTTPIYDDVPKKAKPPFITLGAITAKPNRSKDSSVFDCSVQLHIWSEYHGRLEVNSVMDDISAVLSGFVMELECDFRVIDQDLDFFEAFEEENYGYHGVITVAVKIQDLRRRNS